MKRSVKITLICVTAFAVTIALTIGFFFLLIEPEFKLFDSTELDTDKLVSYSNTVTILDANGKPLDDALYDNNKIYVDIDDLHDYTRNAFIAIEDKRFYKHDGIDYKRMASAFLANVKSRSFREGASTITQQLIKNTHLSNEKTLKRKLTEIRLARALERVYDKDEILESYLNILYFGSGIRGLGTASRIMFGKSASELTLAQSAALASIINNPSKYSPYNNPQNLAKRTELVLDQMLAQGYISEDERLSALAEELVFDKDKQNQYVSGILKDACNRLHCSEKALFGKNVTIKTAYDKNIATATRQALSQFAADDKQYTARVLILDNASGNIVCDETNTAGHIEPRRSPASTIKPFISYAPALESGANPLSQIADEPTAFGDYAPGNYKNVYRGYISLKDCLIYSSNVAAVKLLQQTGVDKAKSTASSFGLTFDDKDDSLSLALGGMTNGVTLTELANAYRTLANGGVYSPVSYAQSIGSVDGNYTQKAAKHRVVGEDTAYLLTDMLTECAKAGTAKKLKYCGTIAAKTGTNGDANGNYDCYGIAYTPEYTIAVWFGAPIDGRIDNKITGASCCKIIEYICDKTDLGTDKKFNMPESVAYYEIDASELNESHEVYLADPTLPSRYRMRALLSKRHLPIRKSIDIVDFYDRFVWEEN